MFGTERPVTPAAAIGPLRGKARGDFGDFAWVNPWTPLLRETIWQAAETAEVKLAGVRADLHFSRKSEDPLVEIEALQKVRLLSSLVPERCTICGRLPITRPEQLVLEASSFDSSVALQRVMELPTTLIANASFAQFIEERNLRDVVLTPVELR